VTEFQTSAAQMLTDKLRAVVTRMERFQRDLAFGDLLIALNEAARQDVTLNAEHQILLDSLEKSARRMWPFSVFGIDFASRR
jgi:hypothetical protein